MKTSGVEVKLFLEYTIRYARENFKHSLNRWRQRSTVNEIVEGFYGNC